MTTCFILLALFFAARGVWLEMQVYKLRQESSEWDEIIARYGHPMHLEQRLEEYMIALSEERDKITKLQENLARGCRWQIKNPAEPS